MDSINKLANYQLSCFTSFDEKQTFAKRVVTVLALCFLTIDLVTFFNPLQHKPGAHHLNDKSAWLLLLAACIWISFLMFEPAGRLVPLNGFLLLFFMLIVGESFAVLPIDRQAIPFCFFFFMSASLISIIIVLHIKFELSMRFGLFIICLASCFTTLVWLVCLGFQYFFGILTVAIISLLVSLYIVHEVVLIIKEYYRIRFQSNEWIFAAISILTFRHCFCGPCFCTKPVVHYIQGPANPPVVVQVNSQAAAAMTTNTSSTATDVPAASLPVPPHRNSRAGNPNASRPDSGLSEAAVSISLA